jgi:ketosteroid isomerase-like protein
MTAGNVEILRRVVAAFNRHDLQEMERLAAPNLEIVPLRAMLEDTTYRGRRAVAAFIADSDETWESIRYDIEDIEDAGDALLVRARLRGRGRTSGADVDAEVTSIARFEDAKLASLRSFDDRAKALADLGDVQANERGVD